MTFLKIKNNTDLDIPIDKWFKEIKNEALKVDKSYYPVNVIISYSKYDKDNYEYERSSYNIDKNLMNIKVVPNNSDKILDKIKWSFLHEFRHFMQHHIDSLRAATLENNDNLDLKSIIDRIKELNDEDFYQMFHDTLVHESDAIVFATERVGKNFRKHPLRIMIKKYFED